MLTELFIQRSLENSIMIESAIAKYPAIWSSVIRDWMSAEGTDAAWLTYSANYLLRTANVKWALDPYSLLTRAGNPGQPNFVKDLAGLKLVVLSHAHNDHFDPQLISAIQDLPITWVVPDFMENLLNKTAHIDPKRILIPRVGESIHFDNLTLTPFEALHFRDSHGVPELGYLAEFSGRKWLFPGDTRSYEIQRLPRFEKLNGVVAHLWLGKGKALEEKPLLLDSFCQFFVDLQPEQIVVTHFQELGRDADDYWDVRHFQQVQARFKEIASGVKVSSALIGQRIDLF